MIIGETGEPAEQSMRRFDRTGRCCAAEQYRERKLSAVPEGREPESFISLIAGGKIAQEPFDAL
jgi:hypothetical protein